MSNHSIGEIAQALDEMHPDKVDRVVDRKIKKLEKLRAKRKKEEKKSKSASR